MKSIKACTILLLLLLFPLCSARGQVLDYNRFTVDDGLASNFVNCIWQDGHGFLWIGTDNGLQRYDGRWFRKMHLPVHEGGLPLRPVHQIVEGTGEMMWLRMGNTVGIFNTTTLSFKKVPVQGSLSLYGSTDCNLWKNGRGDVLLSVKGKGIFIYDKTRDVFTEDGLPFATDKGARLNAIFEDVVTGRYWLASDKGLAVYDIQRKELYTPDHNPLRLHLLELLKGKKEVSTFHIDKKRNYWVVLRGDKGSYALCYDEVQGQLKKDTAGLGIAGIDSRLSGFRELNNGMLWAYGTNFLRNYFAEQRFFFNHIFGSFYDFGIRFNKVSDIFEDREHCLWLATDYGLYITLPDYARLMHWEFAKPDMVSPARIETILQLSDGRVVYGKRSNGIRIHDSTLSFRLECDIYKSWPGDNDYNIVWDLCQQSGTGLLWIACQGGKIITHDFKKGRTAWLHPAELGNETLTQIREDGEGRLWIGTEGGRLFKYNSGTKAVYEEQEHLPGSISRLLPDNEGRLWISVAGKGVYVADVINCKRLYHLQEPGGPADDVAGNSGRLGSAYTRIEGLSDNNVYEIVQLNDSIMALGGEGGLDLFNINSGKIRSCTMAEGLPGSRITAMQTDEDGQLWINTNNGICRYNYKEHIFFQYTKYDRLTSATTGDNIYVKAIRLRNGDMAFAGNQSLLYFNPAKFKDNGHPPPVMITEFRILDKLLPPGFYQDKDKMELSWKENSISLSFASLSFLQRNKLKYFYKLEGVDKDWKIADRTLTATYTTLPPGSYTFKVKCENEEGLSSIETKISITIAPPFWKTWWFYSLLGLLVIFLVYLGYRQRMKHLMALQNIRMRVARDLHDDMGATLSTINILSEMAKMKVNKDTGETKEYLEKISDNSIQMQEAMDDIVWSINPGNDSLERITARMREFTATILEPKDIGYSFTGEDQMNGITLNMEKRRDLFLVFKEAVNNVAKYSGASHVIIQLAVKDKGIEMIIQDNGAGFQPEKMENGNGLGNMKKRATLLGGTLQIQSAPGVGTRIILRFPLKK
jgi:signal transduction histidine kinase/ligand-binding sensor domain-containing protein